MMQDKKIDDTSDEKYFLEQNVGREELQRETSVHRNEIRKGARKILFWGMALLLIGFATPLLLVFLIKSPQPGEHLLIFGISYFKLLYILFLTSAIMIHASLFLLRAKSVVVLVFFVVSLFCCLPFIIGLRNDLTLEQVILNIPFFADWPFFLNPAYVLIEFLLPMGVVIYLFLQIKSLFSKKSGGYAFLCVALYLSVAAMLGLFGLNEAQQPNIGVALAQVKNYFANRHPGALFREETFRNPLPGGNDNSQIENRTGSSIQIPVEYIAEPLKGSDDAAGVSLKVEQLDEKVVGLEEQLREIKELFNVREGALQKKPGAAVAPETGIMDSRAEESAIAGIREEIRLLSMDVRAISKALRQMALFLPATSEKIDKEAEIKREEKDTDIEEMYP